MMTLAQLRTRVEHALEQEGVKLGTATIGGQAVPALNIGDWPEGTTVQGLEIIISRNPTQEPIPGFEFVGFITSYPIRAVNWSGAEDLEAVANAIASEFWPLAQDPARIPESPSYPEQITLAVTP